MAGSNPQCGVKLDMSPVNGLLDAPSIPTGVTSGTDGSCHHQDQPSHQNFQGKTKTVIAVNDISFEVHERGDLRASGVKRCRKSTLIRILTTLLSPTSGQAFVNNYDIAKDPEKIRGIIGVCPQNYTSDIELTAYDNLEFYGKLENVPDTILPDGLGNSWRWPALPIAQTCRWGRFPGG